MEYETRELECPRCKGTGLDHQGDCLMCNGKGTRNVTLPVEQWEDEEDEI